MICPKCSAELSEEDVFCKKCGFDITSVQIGKAAPRTMEMPDKNKKRKLLKRALQIPQAIISLAVAVLLTVFIFLSNTLDINPAGSFNTFVGESSLFQFLSTLITGGQAYNSTWLSIALGVVIAILFAGAIVFWLLAASAALFSKGKAGLRRSAFVLTVASYVVLCALPYLLSPFLPQIKTVFEKASFTFMSDLLGYATTFVYVFAGLVLVLMIIVSILAYIEKTKTKKA